MEIVGIKISMLKHHMTTVRMHTPQVTSFASFLACVLGIWMNMFLIFFGGGGI